jgi:hypothetical protein
MYALHHPDFGPSDRYLAGAVEAMHSFRAEGLIRAIGMRGPHRYDITTNQIERTLVHLRPQGLQFVSVTDTYAAPGELDVMAEATGFDSVGRYGSWARDAFTAVTSGSVSVFRLRDRL